MKDCNLCALVGEFVTGPLYAAAERYARGDISREEILRTFIDCGTGSGKTSFQHAFLTHLAQARSRVWVLDGKRIEFAGFRAWPNVELVAARVEHQVRMLHAAHELMEQRYTQLEQGTARLEDFESLALVIDEYATFKARVQRWYKTVKPNGGPTQAPVLELLSDLARLARSAKIHMLLGIQRADVEFLGGEMRDSFGARLSLGRLSPQGAMMMWDSPAIGVALPRTSVARFHPQRRLSAR